MLEFAWPWAGAAIVLPFLAARFLPPSSVVNTPALLVPFFHRLKEQARECHRIGLGAPLKDLMDKSAWADFLQPYALALGAAAADDPGNARLDRQAQSGGYR